MSDTKISPAVRFTGYHVTIESGYRWLGRFDNATEYYGNRHHWPSAEEAQAALDRWLDLNPKDPAHARLRPQKEIKS